MLETKNAWDPACGNRGGDVVEMTARPVTTRGVELRSANPNGEVKIRKHVA
jgi:hypothetical protein